MSLTGHNMRRLAARKAQETVIVADVVAADAVEEADILPEDSDKPRRGRKPKADE